MYEDPVMKTIRRLSEMDRPTIKMEEQRLRDAIAKQLADKAQSATSKLAKEEREKLPLGGMRAFGLMDTSTEVLTLPQDHTRHRDVCWLVELQGLGTQLVSLGVEILGDVVLGINRPSVEPPDLDLSRFQAEEKGVSRRHAVIRPNKNRLYLIDLQSTNGTRVNALTVNAGFAHELHSGDTITLGTLTFTLKILATPDNPINRTNGDA